MKVVPVTVPVLVSLFDFEVLILFAHTSFGSQQIFPADCQT